MGLSCFLIAVIGFTGTLILVPIAFFFLMCCLGFTREGIRAGSIAACGMRCGDGYTPEYISMGQSYGTKAGSCKLCNGYVIISLVVAVMILFNCSTVTTHYCERLITNSTFCYNVADKSCFTFFHEGNCVDSD